MTKRSFGLSDTMPAKMPQLSNTMPSREKVNADNVPPAMKQITEQFSGFVNVNGLAPIVTEVLGPLHIPLTLEVATIICPYS